MQGEEAGDSAAAVADDAGAAGECWWLQDDSDVVDDANEGECAAAPMTDSTSVVLATQAREVQRSWTYTDQALDELLPSLVLPLVVERLKASAVVALTKVIMKKQNLPGMRHVREIAEHVREAEGDLAAWLADTPLSTHIQAFAVFVVGLAESSGLVGAPRWAAWAPNAGAKDLWWQLAALLGLVVPPVERDAARWRVDRATTLRLLRSPLLGAADAVAALEVTAAIGDYPKVYDGLRAVLAAVGLDAAAVDAHEREAAAAFPAYAPLALAKRSTLRAIVLTQKQGGLVKDIFFDGEAEEWRRGRWRVDAAASSGKSYVAMFLAAQWATAKRGGGPTLLLCHHRRMQEVMVAQVEVELRQARGAAKEVERTEECVEVKGATWVRTPRGAVTVAKVLVATIDAVIDLAVVDVVAESFGGRRDLAARIVGFLKGATVDREWEL